MDTLALLALLHKQHPYLDASVHMMEGFTVIGYVADGDLVTDPIEMKHRLGDYGNARVTDAEAQLISDHNKTYNDYQMGG